MIHTITSGKLTAKINSFGAELTSVVGADGFDYIWQCPGEGFWADHSPVLFPHCGRILNSTYTYGGVSYDMMNEELSKRDLPNGLLFLPFLVGTNSPEFDTDANGVFFGLRQEHTAAQMAKAVMEGVCFVLRKNCEDILAKGTKISGIVATGGGAKSPVWCQLQADITGLPVEVPAVTEAACLGAVMLAAWRDGQYETLSAAAKDVKMVRSYAPAPSALIETKYRKFCKLYEAALEIAKM